jgi:hypothetical protein
VQQNFSFIPTLDIEKLVQESILNLIKCKTGIRSSIQLRRVDYFQAFKAIDGRIKMTAVFMRPKMCPKFVRISANEINLSGATDDEFFNFLDSKGAKRVCDKKKVLEMI